MLLRCSVLFSPQPRSTTYADYWTGLHKEPSLFPGIDRIEVHVRRQLWWSLVSLDGQIALAAGLPALIDVKIYDVQPITDLAESAIDSPPVGGSDTIKQILRDFVAENNEFYRRMAEFVHILHNSSLDESDLDKLLDIIKDNQLDLYARRDRISSAVKDSMVNGSPASGSAVFRKFTKMVLSMIAAKPFEIMYGPIRRHGLLDRLRQKDPT